jgi:16S rRNA (guanine1207-N2)-methyltransferase
MNPPFHAGRAADPGLGRAMIEAAARALSPQGQLWLVANRHLPYEAALAELFRQVEEIGGDGGFKLLRAGLPLKARAGGAGPSRVQRTRRAR